MIVQKMHLVKVEFYELVENLHFSVHFLHVLYKHIII